RSGFDKLHCGPEFQCIPQFFDNVFLEFCKVSKFSAEIISVDLHFYSHLIKMINSVNIYHKLISHFGYFQEYMFDLGGKNINSSNNKHIIASSCYPGNLFTSPANAPVFHEHTHISCAV